MNAAEGPNVEAERRDESRPHRTMMMLWLVRPAFGTSTRAWG